MTITKLTSKKLRQIIKEEIKNTSKKRFLNENVNIPEAEFDNLLNSSVWHDIVQTVLDEWVNEMNDFGLKNGDIVSDTWQGEIDLGAMQFEEYLMYELKDVIQKFINDTYNNFVESLHNGDMHQVLSTTSRIQNMKK